MLIGPVVAPLGTVAVICVSEFTAKEAAAPLNATAVAPVKCEPLIVTPAPALALAGLNELIVGAEGATVTVKLVALVAVPPGVVTLIAPLVAPLGTVAVICVSEFTVKEAAAPLNATAVAPAKCEPLIVTPAPTGPLAGLKEESLGAEGATATVKLVALVAVPPGVVTLIAPLVAPLGTVAVICVSEFTVKEAAAPLNATAVAPVKCEPLIVTPAPTGPLAGLNELIIGADGHTLTVYLASLNPAPPGSPALIGPWPARPPAPAPGSV